MTGLFIDPRIDQRLIALLLLRRLLPLALEYNACRAAPHGQSRLASFEDRRRHALAAYGFPADAEPRPKRRTARSGS